MESCTTVEELKRVYKKLALKHHPDKGGDPEKFNAIREEYEKRLEHLNHTDAEEVLDLHVSLHEAYTGFTKVVPVVTETRCSGCSQVCQMCHGRGQLNIQLGPFTMSHPCTLCEGRGGSVPSGCSLCKQSGRLIRRTEYTIRAQPGVDSGERIGRFNIIVDPNPNFTRKGQDLYTTIKIPFDKSTSPQTISIRHLNKLLTIDTAPWVPIDPRIHHVVKGEGMTSHGDLHIIFDIQYKHGNISA